MWPLALTLLRVALGTRSLCLPFFQTPVPKAAPRWALRLDLVPGVWGQAGPLTLPSTRVLTPAASAGWWAGRGALGAGPRPESSRAFEGGLGDPRFGSLPPSVLYRDPK